MIPSPVRKSRRLVYDFGFKMTIVVCWIAVAKEKKVDHNYTLLFVIYQPASNKKQAVNCCFIYALAATFVVELNSQTEQNGRDCCVSKLPKKMELKACGTRPLLDDSHWKSLRPSAKLSTSLYCPSLHGATLLEFQVGCDSQCGFHFKRKHRKFKGCTRNCVWAVASIQIIQKASLHGASLATQGTRYRQIRN